MKLVISKYKIYLLLLAYVIHQFYYATKIGTWWDESYNRLAIKLTGTKVKYLISGVKANEYRFDFSDHEFFGMFYQVQVYFFTKIVKLYEYIDLNFLKNSLHFEFFLRHVYLILYTCFGLYIIFKILKRLENEQFAFLYITFLILIPSVNGFGLFDDKDIPFGIHLFISYLMYQYFVKRYRESNSVDNKLLFYTGLSFGILLLIRFNGVAFLIFILASINILNLKNLVKRDYLIQNFTIAGYALLVFLVGTVQGWSDYPKYLKNLYWQQFKVSTWNGVTIVNGETFERSGDISYIFKILFYKLPVPYLIMILISLIFITKFTKNTLFLSGLNFLIIFSLAYIVFKPAAYSYERQYLFIFFFLNLIAIFCLSLFIKFKFRSLVTIMILFLVINSQLGLKEYKYVNLNEFVDENNITNINEDCFEKGECGDWSTDHLSISGLEMSNMISDVSLPIFSCAPIHTISIFSNEDNLINLNGVYTIESGQDAMDYTFERSTDVPTGKILVYNNKKLFAERIDSGEVSSFVYLSEHKLTQNGLSCLNYLNNLTSFKCKVVDENFVKLRNVKITTNFLLQCDL